MPSAPSFQPLAARLLSPLGKIRDYDIEDVDERDWETLSSRFEAHRVAGLAHWCAQQRGDLARLPRDIVSRWSDERSGHTLRSLHLKQALADLATSFSDQGYRAVALKGAYLAFFAYPEPALRPMRDLDFLFPDRSQAVDAWEKLRSDGYEPYVPFEGDVAASLEERHQLPALVSPDGIVAVELHHRLFHRGKRDPADDPAFWKDVVERPLLGTTVAFPAPEWLALHLAIHAVRDHWLDCGPNVIADVAMLDRSDDLRRVSMAEMAGEWDAGNEWALVSTLVDDQWDGEHEKAESALVRDAWAAMLADPASITAARQRLRALDVRHGNVLSKLLPGRAMLEGRYGSTNALGLISHLVRHYAHLVGNRLPAVARPADPEMERVLQRLRAYLRSK